MTPTLPPSNSKFSLPASEIERFRARHRCRCRGQQQTATPSKIEALDVDEGRTRKISAKWRQKQQQTQLCNQFEDGYWPKSAGTEMHVGFNAFDFSASPEAFYDDAEEAVEIKSPTIDTNQQDEEQPEPSVEAKPVSADEDELKDRKQHMDNVAKQVTAMGFNTCSASIWERSLRQSGGPFRQLPALNQNLMWGTPVHYATYDDQRRALYYRPQYYA